MLWVFYIKAPHTHTLINTHTDIHTAHTSLCPYTIYVHFTRRMPNWFNVCFASRLLSLYVVVLHVFIGPGQPAPVLWVRWNGFVPKRKFSPSLKFVLDSSIRRSPYWKRYSITIWEVSLFQCGFISYFWIKVRDRIPYSIRGAFLRSVFIFGLLLFCVHWMQFCANSIDWSITQKKKEEII